MRRHAAYWIASAALMTVAMPTLRAQCVGTAPPPLNIKVVVSPSPSIYGQNLTVFVTTSGPCGIAPGSVKLAIDGGQVGSPIQLDAAGNATINIPDPTNSIPSPTSILPVGNHAVGVVYGEPPSDSSPVYQATTSPTFPTTVNQASTTTSLSASLTTITATVSVTPPGSGSPTGTVLFRNNGTAIGSVPVSGGLATISASGVAGVITAAYSGDSNYIASASGNLRVGPTPTSSLTLASSLNPSTIGQSVTFTASLTVTNGSGAATGTIQFSDGATALGSPVPVSLGQATFTTSSLAVGSHTINASYSGDSQYPATGVNLGQVVNRLATVLGLTSSVAGQAVTLTAQIGPTPPTGIPGPTGQVTFSEGTNQLGAAAVSSSAAAVLQLQNVTSGIHQIVAVYSGDTDWSSARNTITVAVNVGPLTILTVSLPEAVAGVPYSAPPMSASGGAPPLKWAITQTTPSASGILLASDGTFSGTPPNPGTFTLTVQVTDAESPTVSVSKQFTLQVLSITTLTLPGGTNGSPYSATVTASGGTLPYTFSGSLPPNLTINPASGAISGTPAVTGTVSITVTVKDIAGTTASRTFSVAFAPAQQPPPGPSLTFGGIGDTGNPGSQPALQLSLGTGYPLDLTGTLSLTFAADKGGGDNPEVLFANGKKILPFTIPANSTSIGNLQLQTGTVAGLITITAHLTAGGADVTPTPVPTKLIRVNAAPPTILSATATRTATGFTVAVTGFSTTLDVSQAIFQFNGTSNLQTSSLTITVTSLFSGYYQVNTPGPTGSQFLYTQQFTVTGNLLAVTSVSVTLVNSAGNSQTATATLQ